jgi:hypothetical protein
MPIKELWDIFYLPFLRKDIRTGNLLMYNWFETGILLYAILGNLSIICKRFLFLYLYSREFVGFEM